MRGMRCSRSAKGKIVARRHEGVGTGADAGGSVVVAELAVGQGHDRLQIEVDAVRLDGLAQILKHRLGGSCGKGWLGDGDESFGDRTDRLIGDGCRLGDDQHGLLGDHDRLVGEKINGLLLVRLVIEGGQIHALETLFKPQRNFRGSGHFLCRSSGEGWRCRHQLARQILDQAFQRLQLGADLDALGAGLLGEIGAERVEAPAELLDILREAIDMRGADAHPGLGAGIFGHGLIEALDPVVQEIEPRHVVLDLIDALQIAVEHHQRLFQLVHAAGDGGRAGLAGDDVMGGGHHHEERRRGDHAGHGVDA